MEHYFHFLSRFQAIRDTFRGKMPTSPSGALRLSKVVKVLVELDAWYLREHPLDRLPRLAYFPE